jgi:hypothetical protein
MLLVDRRFRGRGIGTQLMKHAMQYLVKRRVGTMRLDATPMGRPIYEKLGFVAEYGLVRLEGVPNESGDLGNVQTVSPNLLSRVLALDAEVTGTQRSRLIRYLYQERPDAMLVVIRGERVAGYLTSRPGINAAQIGPGVAMNAETGLALAETVLCQHRGRPVFVDIPVDNVAAMRWAESRGLTVQRPFTRMRRGDEVVDEPRRLWASSGPEKG